MTPNQLLDAVREGQNYSYEQITAALIATGDLDGGMAQGMRSTGMDEPLERPAERQGDAVGESLVVKGDIKDQRDSRPWCSAYLASRHETTSL
jgi:hypothetical protein